MHSPQECCDQKCSHKFNAWPYHFVWSLQFFPHIWPIIAAPCTNVIHVGVNEPKWCLIILLNFVFCDRYWKVCHCYWHLSCAHFYFLILCAMWEQFLISKAYFVRIFAALILKTLRTECGFVLPGRSWILNHHEWIIQQQQNCNVFFFLSFFFAIFIASAVSLQKCQKNITTCWKSCNEIFDK